MEAELEIERRDKEHREEITGQYERIDKRGKEIVDSQDVFCKEAEAEAVRDDENEGLQKQRVFEPLTAEDAQD